MSCACLCPVCASACVFACDLPVPLPYMCLYLCPICASACALSVPYLCLCLCLTCGSTVMVSAAPPARSPTTTPNMGWQNI